MRLIEEKLAEAVEDSRVLGISLLELQEITLFISIFIFQPYAVSGQSMQPTFDTTGDRVVVFKAAYLFDH